MYNPISTYRIQFNTAFTLKKLQAQKEYFELLGIGAIYASPIFKATPGSEHGYDVVHPGKINPELGTEEELQQIIRSLSKNKIGWIQDMVPNHMAYHTNNIWLMDVLEKGKQSQFYGVFDLEPSALSPENPLMVPFLGSTKAEALEKNEITLNWHEGSFVISYFDNHYPVNYETFRDIFSPGLIHAPQIFSNFFKEQNLISREPDEKFLYQTWAEAKLKLDDLYHKNEEIKKHINDTLVRYRINSELLESILYKQNYRLCHWQDTEKEINFRRFFTVNGLICLRMEDAEVFRLYHNYILERIKSGDFKGLRVDHIDGLNNPTEYLRKLREETGEETFIVAEKILEQDEEIPGFWPIQGTTGYEFLATVNNLLTDVQNYDQLRQIYKEVTQIETSPEELIYKNKKMILTTRMHGEWNNLFEYFNKFGFIDYEREEISAEEMKEALGEFMLACPVYRLYPQQFPLCDTNRKNVEEIISKASQRNPGLVPAFHKLSNILLSNNPSTDYTKTEAFFRRLMQFTGPLMAKGVEDTSMYQYNCFISHNEVGDAINASGVTGMEFHIKMQNWQKNWPFSMNTTSSHDTKRGEDVRARLNVVSELAEEWAENVHKWMQINQKLKTRLDTGILEPSMSVEYFIYQTLLGTFPFDGKVDDTFLSRIEEYLVKALREAKRKVSWRDPDEMYENTICEFATNMLKEDHEFLASFVPFMKKVAWRGIINSLTQTTLKCASPGLPDIYQGTELWDLTLVDPDNRQEVDYAFRHNSLKEMLEKEKENPQKQIHELCKNATDGKIKLWLTHKLLQLRKTHKDLFLQGEYIPLNTTGKHERHILAFLRKWEDQLVLIVVPLITGKLSDMEEGFYLDKIAWENTSVELPHNINNNWTNILSNAHWLNQKQILVQEIFAQSPIGVFINDK